MQSERPTCRSTKNEHSRRTTGIELFAGCGGFSTGFLDAGLAVAAGFEIDRRAVDAYNYNHALQGQSRFRCQTSLACFGEATCSTSRGFNSVDFVIGGPPCQPFSIIGKRLGARRTSARI